MLNLCFIPFMLRLMRDRFSETQPDTKKVVSSGGRECEEEQSVPPPPPPPIDFSIELYYL